MKKKADMAAKAVKKKAIASEAARKEAAKKNANRARLYPDAALERTKNSRTEARLDVAAAGGSVLPGFPVGCLWQIQIVRRLLLGTHDDNSPLRHLRAQHHILEMIFKSIPELFPNTVIAQMLLANPNANNEKLRAGLTLNQDGSIDEWNLSFCDLVVLPELFGGIRTTGDLTLDNNQLSSLPKSFGSIVVGGSLYLINNQLSSLPKSFGSIIVGGNLELNRNQLNSLPDSFGAITVGGNIDLSRNQLSSLPESFGVLTVGGNLELNRNQLTSLPESFGSITIVRDLKLDANQLTSLPDSFRSITVGGDVTPRSQKMRKGNFLDFGVQKSDFKR